MWVSFLTPTILENSSDQCPSVSLRQSSSFSHCSHSHPEPAKSPAMGSQCLRPGSPIFRSDLRDHCLWVHSKPLVLCKRKLSTDRVRNLSRLHCQRAPTKTLRLQPAHFPSCGSSSAPQFILLSIGSLEPSLTQAWLIYPPSKVDKSKSNITYCMDLFPMRPIKQRPCRLCGAPKIPQCFFARAEFTSTLWPKAQMSFTLSSHYSG
jgi:hypothetical protein